MSTEKKRLKSQSKADKKAAKAEAKLQKKTAESPSTPNQGSAAVRYAEAVRGVLYVVTGVSMIVALVMGQRGAIVSLDDLIDGLFAAWVGKLLLSLIAVALLIYGLKHLRLVR